MSTHTALATRVSKLAYFYHSCSEAKKNDGVLDLVSFSQLCCGIRGNECNYPKNVEQSRMDAMSWQSNNGDYSLSRAALLDMTDDVTRVLA